MFYVLCCLSVIIHNLKKKDKRLKCIKTSESEKTSLLVGLESDMGRLGPGVGCLEVEKMERKLWEREAQIQS